MRQIVSTFSEIFVKVKTNFFGNWMEILLNLLDKMVENWILTRFYVKILNLLTNVFEYVWSDWIEFRKITFWNHEIFNWNGLISYHEQNFSNDEIRCYAVIEKGIFKISVLICICAVASCIGFMFPISTLHGVNIHVTVNFFLSAQPWLYTVGTIKLVSSICWYFLSICTLNQ